jgi:hypothetical protein
MLRKEMNKNEVEIELSKMGDYVKIDNLTRFLGENLPGDIKRLCFGRLGETYESKGMFSDAAKSYHGVAQYAVTFAEKIKAHLKEAELYVKAGFYEKADEAARKAMGDANSIQKQEVVNKLKEFYLKQVNEYEKSQRRNNSVKLYEKMFNMALFGKEKEDIKQKLLYLYQQLGKSNEYRALKGGYR